MDISYDSKTIKWPKSMHWNNKSKICDIKSRHWNKWGSRKITKKQLLLHVCVYCIQWMFHHWKSLSWHWCMSQWVVDGSSMGAVQCTVSTSIFTTIIKNVRYLYAVINNITLKTTVLMQVQISQHVNSLMNKIYYRTINVPVQYLQTNV